LVAIGQLHWGGGSLRIILAAFLLISCAGCGTSPPEATGSSVADQPTVAPIQAEMRDLTATEKTALAEDFTSGLNDPESVKFQWTKVAKRLSNTDHSFDYCALINMKSDSGVYKGLRPFLATIRTENGNIVGGAIAALNSDDREENRDVIPKLCRQKGLNPFDAK
jgi:hypothetical protein